MTREEAITQLKEHQQNGDIESAHEQADNVLRELLITLGYQDVVDEFDQIEKWYA
jgi:hypothetical protein